MEATNACACCLSRRGDRGLNTPYCRADLDEPEVYSAMLANCFDIHLPPDIDDECGICQECVGRLRDASDFKLQVQRSQAELRERLERALQAEDVDPLLLPSEMMMTEDGAPCEESTLNEEPEVKSERSSEEDETGDEMWLGTGRTCGSGALSRAVSARARQQLAMTCSVRFERLHECRICHSSFGQESTLTTHMEEMHTDSAAVRAEEEACTCDTCGEQFTDKMDLVNHIQKHMKTPYSCKICSIEFPCKILLSKHSRTHKTPKVYPCNICSKAFSTKYKLNRHGVVHTRRKQYNCGICNTCFHREDHLTEHIKQTGHKPYKCGICKKQFALKKSLTRHIKIHTGQTPYEMCNKQFTRNSHLTEHIRIHTRQKPYECEICNKRFTQINNFNSHMQIHTGQKQMRFERLRGNEASHQSRICHSASDQESTLTKHMEEMHTDSAAVRAEEEACTCDTCGERFTDKMDLVDHVRKHMKTPYSCKICSTEFPCKIFLSKHSRTHKTPKGYPCNICSKAFASTYKLNRHGVVHTRRKQYSCGICNTCFHREDHLTEHIKQTGHKPYKCGICKKQFAVKLSLTRHIRIHTGQTPYKCEMCNKQFTQNSHLTQHIRIHTRQKQLRFQRLRDDEALHQSRICHSAADQKSTLTTHMEEMHTDSAAVRAEKESSTCDTCGERFTDKIDFDEHIQNHMKTSYSCKICSIEFPCKILLSKHSRTHKTPKVYPCNSCSKAFSTKYKLNRHGVVHTRRKQYSCGICNTCFHREDHLIEHIKQSGHKPYTCILCDKKFASNSSLARHVRIHTGQKPFKCETCNKRFGRNSTLKYHMRIHTGQKS